MTTAINTRDPSTERALAVGVAGAFEPHCHDREAFEPSLPFLCAVTNAAGFPRPFCNDMSVPPHLKSCRSASPTCCIDEHQPRRPSFALCARLTAIPSGSYDPARRSSIEERRFVAR